MAGIAGANSDQCAAATGPGTGSTTEAVITGEDFAILEYGGIDGPEAHPSGRKTRTIANPRHSRIEEAPFHDDFRNHLVRLEHVCGAVTRQPYS